MIGHRQTIRRWIIIGARIIVGALFVYAGVLKIGDPLALADNIASFQILPATLINPFALAIPCFEILAGALLVAGIFHRAAALAIAIVTGVFLIAIVIALARGLTIDCGCFGTAAASRYRMWLDVGRDAALFLGAIVAYR